MNLRHRATQAGLGLASIIGSPDEGPWHSEMFANWSSNGLPGDHPLTRLHSKFWGRSMEDEEQDWHRSKLGCEDERGDESVHEDGDESEDESERTNLGDDLIRGCYVLDIDIEGLEYRRIWIRADYIRVYDYLQDHFENSEPLGRLPGAVLTGQPGIGKCVWILYALRRRLAERKAVIWYWRQKCYLFVDEGVYAKPDKFLLGDFKPIVWTLVDSDEAPEGPWKLVAHGTRLSVVYVTPPAKKRWSRMDKTVLLDIAVMNPWTRREIHRAAPLRLLNPDFELINRVYDHFGPTPRLCFEEASTYEDLESYMHGFDKALKRLTQEKLESLFREVKSLTMGTISRKIYLIQRAVSVEISDHIRISPMTDFVQSRLATIPSTRGMSGSDKAGKRKRAKVTEVALSGEEGEMEEPPTKRR